MTPGTLVQEKYRVQGRLGHQASQVFQASIEALGQVCALKLGNESLVRATRILSRLKGERSVGVLDLFALPSGEACVAMELLQGRDFATILATEGLPPMQHSVGYVLQACEALAALHAVGIVHGDVKPGHLFATATPNGPIVKLVDFAAARDPSEGPQALMRPSGLTLGYAAPEHVTASHLVSPASDQFSLGVVLFEMLTGGKPFGGQGPNVPALDVRQFQPSLPAGLAAIVARALSMRQEDRFPNIAELARALVPLGPPNFGVYADSAAQRLGAATNAAPQAPTQPPPTYSVTSHSSPRGSLPAPGPAPLPLPGMSADLSGSAVPPAAPPFAGSPFPPAATTTTAPSSGGLGFFGLLFLIGLLAVGYTAIQRFGTPKKAEDSLDTPIPPPTETVTKPAYVVDPTPLVPVTVGSALQSPVAASPVTCQGAGDAECRKALAAAQKARDWKAVKGLLVPAKESLGCADLAVLKAACASLGDACAKDAAKLRADKRCK